MIGDWMSGNDDDHFSHDEVTQQSQQQTRIPATTDKCGGIELCSYLAVPYYVIQVEVFANPFLTLLLW